MRVDILINYEIDKEPSSFIERERMFVGRITETSEDVRTMWQIY